MASQVCENLALINSDDEVKGMEVMEISGALLMSLMEESPCNERDDDDDRLNSIIRSLEAEINVGDVMDGCDSALIESKLVNSVEDITRTWNVGLMDGLDYLAPCDFEMGWVDMDLMPSSQSDDSWCIEPLGDEMDGIIEIFDGYNHQFWTDL